MKGLRTISFNGLGFLAILAELVIEFGKSPEVAAYMPPEHMLYVLMAVFGANIILRLVTTTPVGQK